MRRIAAASKSVDVRDKTGATPLARAAACGQAAAARALLEAGADATALLKRLDADPYACLGLSKTTDDAAVKKAYKKRALRFHPDKNSWDSTELFQALGRIRELAQRLGVDGGRAAAPRARRRAWPVPVLYQYNVSRRVLKTAARALYLDGLGWVATAGPSPEPPCFGCAGLVTYKIGSRSRRTAPCVG